MTFCHCYRRIFLSSSSNELLSQPWQQQSYVCVLHLKPRNQRYFISVVFQITCFYPSQQYFFVFFSAVFPILDISKYCKETVVYMSHHFDHFISQLLHYRFVLTFLVISTIISAELLLSFSKEYCSITIVLVPISNSSLFHDHLNFVLSINQEFAIKLLKQPIRSRTSYGIKHVAYAFLNIIISEMHEI